MLLLSLCLIAVLNLFLGFLVLFRNPKKVSSIAFFCLTLFGDSWLVTNYFADHADTVAMGVIWTRLMMAFGLLTVLSLLYFLSTFIDEKKSKAVIRRVLSVPVLLTTFILLFTASIVQTVTFKDSVAEITFGSLSILYLLVFVLTLALSLFTLVSKFIQARGVDKKRFGFLFLGLSLTFVLVTITNLILPLVFNIYTVSAYGGNATVLLIGFTTYAIVKHRLMDIRTVVAKSVVFAVLLAIIGVFYTFTMIWLEKIIFPETGGNLTSGQIIFRIVLTLFVVFTFQPLRKFITKKTDRIFFKQSYNPDELLDRLAHTMSSSIVLIELLYKVLNILTNDMKVSRGFFVILKDGEKIDTTQGIGYKKSPSVEVKEIQALSKGGVCIYDELDEKSQIKRILRKHDASIAIPLKSSNKVSGILFLGEKSSGDMYSAQDLRIFEILGPEVTVAIENAKSYEEIQQFNTVLRSEITKATKELETANKHLTELDKAKDEFITMASHQLRTPLTAIKGYLSMLMEGDAGEIKVGQYEFVQEAYYGATRMVSLINDLLNVSRMETGKFALEIAEFDMTKTVEEEIKQLDKAVKDKGLKLDFKKSGHIKLCADEMKVRQVVMNFVDNAIYYTPEGKMTVKLYKEGKNVCFEVVDNGIGVPEEQQKHLFTKFYRAENARSTRPDGTGLGLFMAKKVIEEHHGEIIFHSKEGEGSTFGFRLPQISDVKKSSTTSFDSNIPLSTPVDKAIEIMDAEIKKDVDAEEKEPAKV